MRWGRNVQEEFGSKHRSFEKQAKTGGCPLKGSLETYEMKGTCLLK